MFSKFKRLLQSQFLRVYYFASFHLFVFGFVSFFFFSSAFILFLFSWHSFIVLVILVVKMFISIAIYILFKKKKFFIFLKKKNSFLSKSQQKSGQIFGENARPPYLSDD